MRRDPRSIPFRDAAVLALSRSLVSPQTLRAYRNIVRGLDGAIGDVACADLASGEIRGALQHLRERGCSPKTMLNALSVIRTVLAEVGCKGAADGIRVPQQPRLAQSLDLAQAKLLRETLAEHDTAEDRTLRLILETGLRLGEALALRAGDLRLPSSIRVLGTKTRNAAREVDLSDTAAALLRAAAAGLAPDQCLLRACPRQLRRVLRRRCAQAGVPTVRVHDLRHTRLTLLLLAQVPPLYVSSQAGHARPAYTMQVYGHAAAASAENRRSWCNAV